MKITKYFIIGLISIIFTLTWSQNSKAFDLCNNIDTHYKAIYCGVRLNDNNEIDEEIIKILSKQFSLKEEWIKEILASTICDSIEEYNEKEKQSLPKTIKSACNNEGGISEVNLTNWTLFDDIQNHYEKEKIIRRNIKRLEFKFKSSEQYYNGSLVDAPFDLIVDLNLIEIVLFGSRAEWINDVFKFQKEEENEDTQNNKNNKNESNNNEITEKDDTQDDTSKPTDDKNDKNTIECVAIDDKDADKGDGPDSQYKNKLCGNGIIDILMAESCDDGNTKSGDGCNQYCQIELTGSNDICIDPEAVTFKKPEEENENKNTINGDKENEKKDKCPPGTVAKKEADKNKEQTKNQGVEQDPNYPGPFIGGTLKQFPKIKTPTCPKGYTDARTMNGGVSLEASGEETLGINIAGKQINIERCLPTNFCASFDNVRDFLFKKDWKKDENLEKIAESIEALFCVNLKKENRPQSPYKKNEGCIDCHITAMVDALEKALETNVSPLQNTTSAFAISSKYGPSFSFNLNVGVKGVLKKVFTKTDKDSIEKANERYKKSIKKSKKLIKKVDKENISSGEIEEREEEISEIEKEIFEDTRRYKMTNGVISDQEMNARINPLFNQIKESFIRIQAKFEDILSSTNFDKKEACIKK